MSTLRTFKIIALVLLAGVVVTVSGLVVERLYEPERDPLALLLAAADLEAGQRAITTECKLCHTLEKGGKHRLGPSLWEILNRPVASADGFAYSRALQNKSDEIWSYANLDSFLKKPKEWAPGTSKSFVGIEKDGERADLIAYLRTLSENPAPLPQ